MRTTVRAVLVAVALVLAPASAGAAPNAVEKLMASERAALQDPGAGRLYPLAAALLASARELPTSIELTRPAVPPAPQPPAAQQPASAAPEAAAPLVSARPAWLHVVEGPVVDEETLAYTCFQAADYAGAARLYAQLHQQKPDDLHFLQMLFLSTRNSGDAKAAAPLLAELKTKTDSREWADWISAMGTLQPAPKEEK